jgi:hypothetical protein
MAIISLALSSELVERALTVVEVGRQLSCSGGN